MSAPITLEWTLKAHEQILPYFPDDCTNPGSQYPFSDFCAMQ